MPKVIPLPTLIRLAARRIWGPNLTAKYGEYSDVNFTNFLNEQTSPARVNQHFSGSYPADVHSKDEYIAGLEGISAYEANDVVGAYLSKFPNVLKGREMLKVKFFGKATGSTKAIRSTGRDGELNWLFPCCDLSEEAAE